MPVATLPPADANLEALYTRFRQTPLGLTTDSRQLQAGQGFVALKGATYDANQFAAQALAQGAAWVVLDDADIAATLPPDRQFLVSDCLTALQQLARRHRQTLTAPIIAIGGSNGKTTTKELLHAVFSQAGLTFATPGNWNNHIGIPLSLLRVTDQHQYIILELGDNAPGEVAFLCAIAEPTHGLITNIGLDHLEGFGGMEANIRTKLELFDYLIQRQGYAFVNLRDAALHAWDRSQMAHSTYGPAGQFQVALTKATLEGLQFALHSALWAQPAPFHSPLYGTYNLENLLAAATVAFHFGLSPEQYQAGIASYRPTNLRSQVVRTADDQRTLILDAYNANPDSMTAAWTDFVQLDHPGQKAVVLGDMLELGSIAEAEHARLGVLLGAHPEIRLIVVGPLMEAAARAARQAGHHDVHHYARRDGARTALPNLLADTRLVLLKGSRGLAVEKLLPDGWLPTPAKH